jgi:PAS domain S-box-containing protein
LKIARGQRASGTKAAIEPSGLRLRLAVAEETLRAIRGGEVDAVVVSGKRGDRVFTLAGAEQAYRVLIESMNEGALALTADKMILYANHCFAKLVKCPLEQVIGGSFRRFISGEDQTALRRLLKRPTKSGHKIQMLLNARDGSQIPVQMSIRPLAQNSLGRATIGMVVTDMTEVRRTEAQLRALARRVVEVQEAERERVALELHDNITQLLCAIVFRSQALAGKLPARNGSSKRDAMKLHEMLVKTADEVQRISSNLGPRLLEHLGLLAVIRDASAEFANRTGVLVKMNCNQIPGRLPADIELTLYRILQEALRNVERHAHARHVTVRLKRQDALVQLVVNDDGIGFDVDHGNMRMGTRGLGLLGMRERASYVGGSVRIKSLFRAGTEVDLRIPLLEATRKSAA